VAAFGRTQAGDDQIALLPALVHFGDFVARADDAIEPGFLGKIGKAQDLIVRGAADAGGGEIALIEAGEDGDGDDLAIIPGGGLGIFHHRPPARGVDGDDRRLKHVDRLHRAGHGVGNIVQLEIEEDRQADLGDLVHAVVAMGAEEFEAKLEPADMALDLLRERHGGIETG
jgi:hypothetical protein